MENGAQQPVPQADVALAARGFEVAAA